MYSCSTEQDQEPLVGTPMEKGEQLYQMNCARCHGTDGSKGASGAKNLKSSSMSKEQIYSIIQNGKGTMPAYKNTIKSDSSMMWLVEYVQTLRK
jgi:mono/diheme cytochrome c family protein